MSQLEKAVCRDGTKSTRCMGGTVFTKTKASNETTHVEQLTGRLQVINVTAFPFLFCLQVSVPYTSIVSKFTLRSLRKIRFKIIWKGDAGLTPLPPERITLYHIRGCVLNSGQDSAMRAGRRTSDFREKPRMGIIELGFESSSPGEKVVVGGGEFHTLPVSIK